MIYFNEPLEAEKKRIQEDVKDLNENGDSDAASNYLYYLRDEINALLKEDRKNRKNLNK